jgi:hypothetical protein
VKQSTRFASRATLGARGIADANARAPQRRAPRASGFRRNEVLVLQPMKLTA